MSILTLVREPRMLELSGLKRSTARDRIAKGLYPAPIKISARSSAWVLSEILAVNSALVSGATEAELRELVARLVKQRKQHSEPSAI
jgi:prophage regulatory protein